MSMASDKIHCCLQETFKKKRQFAHQEQFWRHVDEDVHIAIQPIFPTCNRTKQAKSGNFIFCPDIRKIFLKQSDTFF